MDGQEYGPLARLGGLIETWMVEQRLPTLGQAAARIGISAETLRLIRNNHYDDLKPDTKRKIDAALGWEGGRGVDELRAGRDPIRAASTGQAAARSERRVASAVEPCRVGGASFEDVLNHLQAAYQLGGEAYGWQALIKMNELHNPLWAEPAPPHDADQSA